MVKTSSTTAQQPGFPFRSLLCSNAKLYLFDLAGYGQLPLRMAEPDVYLIAGWSDRVFDVLSAVDRGADALSVINKTEV